VEGSGCKSKETRGFSCKSVRSRRWNGSDPLDRDPATGIARGWWRWRVDRYWPVWPAREQIWAVNWGSGGPDAVHARAVAGTRRRVAACGGARRRAAARRWCRARVPHLSRRSHRNDGELTVNSTGRTSGRQRRYRTADGGRARGTSPATLPWRRGARQREQTAPTGSLPHGGTTGELDGGGKAAGARLQRRWN
jgi:hypothetical protein